MEDALLMLEFEDNAPSLVPSGYIYSKTYRHRIRFFGLENLIEKLNRIYYFLGLSQDPSGYPGSFHIDEKFFVAEDCLRDHDGWLNPDPPAEDRLPAQWKRCMVLRPLTGRDSCWQGMLIRKDFQHSYKNVHELKELLGYVWLRLKFPGDRSPWTSADGGRKI